MAGSLVPEPIRGSRGGGWDRLPSPRPRSPVDPTVQHSTVPRHDTTCIQVTEGCERGV